MRSHLPGICWYFPEKKMKWRRANCGRITHQEGLIALGSGDSGQTFGLVVVLLESFLNGSHALGLNLFPPLRAPKNVWPVICL